MLDCLVGPSVLRDRGMPQTRQLAWLLVLFCAVVDGLTLTCSIPLQNHVLMGSVVAGAGVNSAKQRWNFWPLLPLSSQSLEWL